MRPKVRTAPLRQRYLHVLVSETELLAVREMAVAKQTTVSDFVRDAVFSDRREAPARV